MEKKENLNEIVKILLEKSKLKLKSSRLLLENNLVEDALSRAYYAAFLSAKAALLIVGEEPRTHRGVITMLGLKLVKKGILSEKVARYLSELLDKRTSSDYAIITYFTREDGEDAISKAEYIVDEITRFIQSTK